MELQTKRLLLRDFVSEDVLAIVKNVGNLNVSRYLSKVNHPYTIENAKGFVKMCSDNAKANPRNDFAFAVTLRDTATLVGCIGLHAVDAFLESATLGYWFGEPYWGNGYATEAATKIRDFAFDELSLRRINVDAYVGNAGSNNVITKIGGEFEGMRKGFCRSLATGEFVDVNQYGIFR